MKKKLIRVDCETGEQITLVEGQYKEVYEAFLSICINVIIEQFYVERKDEKLFIYYPVDYINLLHHYFEII
jgi:hypothetical protein